MDRREELLNFTVGELIYSGNVTDIKIVINALLDELCETSHSEGYSKGFDECQGEYQENDI